MSRALETKSVKSFAGPGLPGTAAQAGTPGLLLRAHLPRGLWGPIRGCRLPPQAQDSPSGNEGNGEFCQCPFVAVALTSTCSLKTGFEIRPRLAVGPAVANPGSGQALGLRFREKETGLGVFLLPPPPFASPASPLSSPTPSPPLRPPALLLFFLLLFLTIVFCSDQAFFRVLTQSPCGSSCSLGTPLAGPLVPGEEESKG